jgi:hypothetical protein
MLLTFRQLLALGLALVSWSATGQSSLPSPPPAISNLHMLTQNSGYIFDGTVLSVQRFALNESSVPTVQITFRVEQAIRGTHSGQVLTIREWAGLWNSGERYRPGERLLLFFYSPGKLGLTSPVGGQFGRFAVDSAGNIISENGRLSASSLGASPQTQLSQKRQLSTYSLALSIQHADRE